MSETNTDIVIVGGGIVGLATARALVHHSPTRVMVLEAEDRLAAHQTGHNSGVIHSGLYYKPGSLKATLCVEGRQALYAYCREKGILHEQCGKVVVATHESQIPALDELARRGAANGLRGVKRMGASELREHEPHVAGVAGLLVPDTGIVDFSAVAKAYAEDIRRAGHPVHTDERFRRIVREGGAWVVETSAGELRCHHLINCGGLQCDRVARACGVDPGLRIVPFRGEYHALRPERRELVRNLIYPVPDPRYPFLGVHFTRLARGGVEAGPNAVLAFKREGYRRSSVSLRDSWEIATYRGFWAMARKHWRMGVGEMYRSWRKSACVRALRELIPEIQARDLQPGGAGVRAQAVEPDGRLVDDFRIIKAERMIHVLNAPSPAATASISIGQHIATLAVRHFVLSSRG